MPSPIDLSLTDFIDFATKTGTPRLSKVREIRQRPPYHPSMDYWRDLREEIQAGMRCGTLTTQSLRAFAASHRDRKKIARFSLAAAGYARFLGNKQAEWFDPPYAIWTPTRLRVRINPEIGVCISGRCYAIKLYFREVALTKQRIDMLTFLMRCQLSTADRATTFAVLDVTKAKLFTAPEVGVDLMPLLLGEAAAFTAIYDGIEPKAA